MVQIACECLKARVINARQADAQPVQIEVDMYTEDFSGTTKHSVFVSMARPAGVVVRIDVVGWVMKSGAPGVTEIFYSERTFVDGAVVYSFVTGTARHGHCGSVVLAGPHAAEFSERFRQRQLGGPRYHA